MLDFLGAVIELFLEAGGIPGPASLEGQRRARVVAGIVALTAILAGHLFLGSVTRTVVLVGGSVVAAWVLAFSLVDLMKAVAGLTTAVGLTLSSS
jgi:hypothetical protein